MLFNSYTYILAFLPIVLVGYWSLQKHQTIWAKFWLIAASLTFYAWWDVHYLPLLLLSMLVNYGIGQRIEQQNKPLLVSGIIFNLGLLGYFKYADFFINNIDQVFGLNIPELQIVLPLAISFFTFQQISYLVDRYQGKVAHTHPADYVLFVTFFPQLIAGPIVHHKEMMPQFANKRSQTINYNNIAKGIFVFAWGLSKKVAVADMFAEYANRGFDVTTQLNLAEAWVTSLSYSLQIYFDFSGYTDMAIGAALMFNIYIPINFNSPYKATDLQDFWRRWHITLSRFLRDYLYIPLGGNRKGKLLTYRNLFLTFLLGGLWHGAAWTFVIWGALHGIGLIIHRLWSKAGLSMPKLIAWFITFNFVNLAFVFFKADSFSSAMKVIKGMAGLSGIALPHALSKVLPEFGTNPIEYGNMLTGIQADSTTLFYIVVFLALAVFFPNTNQMAERFKPSALTLVATIILAVIGLLHLSRISPFLYFQF